MWMPLPLTASRLFQEVRQSDINSFSERKSLRSPPAVLISTDIVVLHPNIGWNAAADDAFLSQSQWNVGCRWKWLVSKFKMSCNSDTVLELRKTLMVCDVSSLSLFPVTTEAETHCFHLLRLTSTPAAFKAQQIQAAGVSLFWTYGGFFSPVAWNCIHWVTLSCITVSIFSCCVAYLGKKNFMLKKTFSAWMNFLHKSFYKSVHGVYRRVRPLCSQFRVTRWFLGLISNSNNKRHVEQHLTETTDFFKVCALP